MDYTYCYRGAACTTDCLTDRMSVCLSCSTMCWRGDSSAFFICTNILCSFADIWVDGPCSVTVLSSLDGFSFFLSLLRILPEDIKRIYCMSFFDVNRETVEFCPAPPLGKHRTSWKEQWYLNVWCTTAASRRSVAVLHFLCTPAFYVVRVSLCV